MTFLGGIGNSPPRAHGRDCGNRAFRRRIGGAIATPAGHKIPLSARVQKALSDMAKVKVKNPVSRIPGWRCPRREQFI